MEQVISQLIQKYPKARIFLFGRGKDESMYFQRWTELYPQCLFVGQHCETMYQELILMSHLDVMLSMDSANMHLASLTGIPVVSIWGATHPMAGFLGYNQKEENIIRNAVEATMLACRTFRLSGLLTEYQPLLITKTFREL